MGNRNINMKGNENKKKRNKKRKLILETNFRSRMNLKE